MLKGIGMRKAALIASVLFVAVVSTACINSFAVHDLNNKAKMYAEKGDYTQAIERLKSSIDLDSSIVETHYNLAVVYTNVENYTEAIEEYKKVIALKPDMAEAYYSLATAQNNLAVDMSEEKESVNLEDSDSSFEVEDLYEDAIENYEKYLELNPNATDKADVEAQIQRLEEYKSKSED